MTRNRKLLMVVLLFLFLRGLVMVFFADTVFPSQHEAWEASVTREFAEGLRLPFLDHVIKVNSMGQVFFSYLRVPVYWLSHSLLAQHLAAVGVHLLVLVLWYRFLSKHFSEQVAVIFGLLYVFAPTLFITVNFVFAWKSHFIQNALGTVIAMGLVYDIVYEEKGRWPKYAGLGLMAGLLSWFDYFFLITLAAVLFFLWMKDRWFPLRMGFAGFLAAFMLGLAPWFYVNTRREFSGLFLDEHLRGYPHPVMFYSVTDIVHYPGIVLERLRDIFFLYLPQVFSYYGSIEWAKFVCYGVFWASFIVVLAQSLRRRAIPKETFLLLFVVVFLVAFCLTPNPLRSRYFAMLYPFIFAIIAIALSYYLSSRRLLVGLVLVFFVISSAGDLVKRLPYFGVAQGAVYNGYLNDGYFGQALRTHGYSLPDVGRFLAAGHGRKGVREGALAQYIEEYDITGLDQPGLAANDRAFLLRTLKNRVAELLIRKEGAMDIPLMEQLVSAVAGELGPDGPFLKKITPRALQRTDLPALNRAISSLNIDDERKKAIHEGIGVMAAFPGCSVSAEYFIAEISPAYRSSFLDGFGYGITRVSLAGYFLKTAALSHLQDFERLLYGNVIDRIESSAVLSAVDRKDVYRGAFSYWGDYESSIFPGYYERNVNILSLYDLINSDVAPFYRPAVYEGIGRGLGLEVSTGEWPYARAAFILSKAPKEYQAVAMAGLPRGLPGERD